MRFYKFLLIFILTACSNGLTKVGDVRAFNSLELMSSQCAEEIIKNYDNQKIIKIVVFPFINGEKIFSDLGYNISNMMKNPLFLSKKFEILERIQLSNLLEELQLSANSDLFSKENLNKIGKFAGADAVLVGDISDMKSYFAVNIRLVDIEQAKILSIGSQNLVSEKYRTDYNDEYQFNTKRNEVLKGKYKITVVKENIVMNSDGMGFSSISINHDFENQKFETKRQKYERKYGSEYTEPTFNESFILNINPELPITIQNKNFKDVNSGSQPFSILEGVIPAYFPISKLTGDGVYTLRYINKRTTTILKFEKIKKL